MSERLQNIDGSGRYRNGFAITMHDDPKTLSIPQRWVKPKLIFVNSMSDLFHEGVSNEFILSVFDVMRTCPQHIFQVLTKRPHRITDFAIQCGYDAFPTNLWLGTSIESNHVLHERLDALAAASAITNVSVRFVSFEPLLGPINVWKGLDAYPVEWAIVGGESGPSARPMHPDWARSVREACGRTPPATWTSTNNLVRHNR
jgi:protein gp37